MSAEDLTELVLVHAILAGLHPEGECENCDVIRRALNEYRELLEGTQEYRVV